MGNLVPWHPGYIRQIQAGESYTPIYLQNPRFFFCVSSSPRRVTWNLNHGRGDSLCKPLFLGFHVKFGGEYDISSWNSQHSPFTSSFWEARPPYTRGSPWTWYHAFKVCQPHRARGPAKAQNPPIFGGTLLTCDFEILDFFSSWFSRKMRLIPGDHYRCLLSHFFLGSQRPQVFGGV